FTPVAPSRSASTALAYFHPSIRVLTALQAVRASINATTVAKRTAANRYPASLIMSATLGGGAANYSRTPGPTSLPGAERQQLMCKPARNAVPSRFEKKPNAAAPNAGHREGHNEEVCYRHAGGCCVVVLRRGPRTGQGQGDRGLLVELSGRALENRRGGDEGRDRRGRRQLQFRRRAVVAAEATGRHRKPDRARRQRPDRPGAGFIRRRARGAEGGRRRHSGGRLRPAH